MGAGAIYVLQQQQHWHFGQIHYSFVVFSVESAAAATPTRPLTFVLSRKAAHSHLDLFLFFFFLYLLFVSFH
jgi:hypothetical protein